MAEIPKIVARRLAVVKLEDHPDPNLLSAFVERSLGKRERVQVVDHLAQCTDCREIVSLSAVQPQIAGTISPVPANPSWVSWPVLRWGALVACVLVVGAMVTLRQKHEARQIAATIAGGKPAVEMQLPMPNNPSEKKVASLQVPNSEAKVAHLAKQTTSPPKAMTARPADENHAAAAASPVEMADARTGSPFAEMVPGRAKDALAESQDARTEKALGAPLARKRSMVSASNALISANVVPRWTLSSDGTLQRSDRKSTRLNSSHWITSRMPSSA